MSEKKEYIERGALKNLIIFEYEEYGDYEMQEILNVIDNSPAADVEPVVRCKDCVAYAGKERKGGGIKLICRFYKCETSPEHFCAHGKERER